MVKFTDEDKKRNLGAVSPTDRRFYRQTREFSHRMKIYRQTHDELGVSHSPYPPLAMPLSEI